MLWCLEQCNTIVFISLFPCLFFKASHSLKGKTISPRRILFFNKAYDYGFFSSSASRESALIYSNGMSLVSLIGHFNNIFKVSLGDRGEEGTQEEKGFI